MFKSELSEDMVRGQQEYDLRLIRTSWQARDMYPELLKRLDDGSDEIRKSVCCCIASFVKAVVPGGLSSTTKEYMLDQLFVHLDDQDTSIQVVAGSSCTAACSQTARVSGCCGDGCLGNSCSGPRSCDAESSQL
jgi:hypothetical protein